jgi:hypothetical protein
MRVSVRLEAGADPRLSVATERGGVRRRVEKEEGGREDWLLLGWSPSGRADRCLPNLIANEQATEAIAREVRSGMEGQARGWISRREKTELGVDHTLDRPIPAASLMTTRPRRMAYAAVSAELAHAFASGVRIAIC